MNFELGSEMWKMNYLTRHERATTKISESPTGIEPMTPRTHGECSVHGTTRTHGEQGLCVMLKNSSFTWSINVAVWLVILEGLVITARISWQ